MKKIKYGIIGFGNAGIVHAKVLNSIKNVDLVAICDINPRKTSLARNLYKVNLYKDFRTMIKKENLDGVSICLPHYLHSGVSIFCMKNKINVLCEKPIATRIVDADKMIKCSYKNKVLLGTIFQHRFEPINLMIKKEIESDKLGSLISTSISVKWKKTKDYYLNWQGNKHMAGGGVLINQAIHFIDLAQWFNGGIKSVIGNMKTEREYITVEDNAIAMVFYNNNSFGVFDCSTSSNPFFGSTIEIIGSLNSIKICDGHIVFWGGKTDNAIKKINFEINKLDRKFWGKKYFGYGHIFQIKDFIKSISLNKLPSVGGEDGKQALKIVLAIINSSKNNKKIII